MRPLVLVLTVLVVGPLLSGCIQPRDEVQAEAGPPTAWQAKDLAGEALDRNGTGHVFYGMVGLESLAAGAYLAGRLPAALNGTLGFDDATIGDGRTESWLGFWMDLEGHPLFTVHDAIAPRIVASNGTDAYPFGRGFLNDLAGRSPVGKGWMDSTTAFTRAYRYDDGVRRLMDRFDVHVLMVLQHGPDDPEPTWTILVQPVHSDEQEIVIIDAIDGDMVSPTSGRVWADDHNDRFATPLAPATTTLWLEEGAGVMYLEFEPTNGVATSSRLQVEVEHPDGTIDAVDASKWPEPFAHRMTSLAPGTYTVRVQPVAPSGEVVVPTADRIHTHWCIAGVMPDPSHASWESDCDRYLDYM